LKLYLELKLEDDFWARVKKIKEPEKLLKISYFLNMDNYYYYSIITARKFYNIYRRDKKVCFDQKILNILFPLPFKDLITELSTKYDIDPTLVYAIIRRESLFDSTAVSPKGAKGLMQLMEKTAIKVNEGQRVNLFKVRENLETGIKYLKSLIDSFGLYYGICAYNAGEKSVKKWKKFVPENEVSIFFDIPYRETRKYLFYVLSDYLVYKLLYPELKLKI
jgi:soluble lytic murein transglycosylase-like protein